MMNFRYDRGIDMEKVVWMKERVGGPDELEFVCNLYRDTGCTDDLERIARKPRLEYRHVLVLVVV